MKARRKLAKKIPARIEMAAENIKKMAIEKLKAAIMKAKESESNRRYHQ